MPDREHSVKREVTRTLDVAERVRLMRDGLVNNSAFFISSLVGMALVPILWRGLGGEMYGLWIAVLSVNGLVGLLDFDLKASVTREVAAAGSQPETIRFVGSAYHAYLLVGVLGGLLISTLGLPLSGALHLSAEGRRVAPFLFSLAGVAFAADQLLLLTTAVLNGLRRFHIVNLISAGGVLLRAAGIVILMLAGEDLISVAIWNSLSSALTAFAAFAVVGRREPQYRFGKSPFEWRTLRAHLGFSLESWATSLAIRGIWESSALLVGLVRGTSWIAPYHVGQKLPLALCGIYGRAAQVLFPSASQYERKRDSGATRELLEAGTRWLFVLTLPACMLLGILAPNILQAWLGQATPDVVLVFRLTTAAVLAGSAAVAAEHVLWGAGHLRKVLLVNLVVLAASSTLSIILLAEMGIVGGAWGLFLPVLLGASALLTVASWVTGAPLTRMLSQVCSGLFLPALACVVSAAGIVYLGDPRHWPGVVGALLAGGGAYGIVLYLGGARDEEKEFIRSLLRAPAMLVRSTYQDARLLRWMVADSWPYLRWWEVLNPVNLLLCWRVCGYTQQNMAGLVNVIKLTRLVTKRGLDGSFVECGVWRGGCAGIMGLLAEKSGRRIWLFDSFVGMPEASVQDIGEHATVLSGGRRGGQLVPVGSNAASLEEVKDFLHHRLGLRAESMVFRKGWFQDTVELSRGEVGPIAILRIDADWHDSTVACLEGLYDNVVGGGFVIIDDYGWFPGCRTAVDGFLARRNLRVELISVDYTRVYFQKPSLT